MQLWESVKELQFFCRRLDFTHIYSLKKLMFLHKLVRQNNACLNVCFSVFKHSTEFLSLCRNFDLVISQCSVSNVKCSVFSCFYNIVESRLRECDSVLCSHVLFFFFFFSFYICFLSRVSILTLDIDIANMSVCLSVCLSVCPLRSGTRWKRLNISS